MSFQPKKHKKLIIKSKIKDILFYDQVNYAQKQELL